MSYTSDGEEAEISHYDTTATTAAAAAAAPGSRTSSMPTDEQQEQQDWTDAIRASRKQFELDQMQRDSKENGNSQASSGGSKRKSIYLDSDSDDDDDDGEQETSQFCSPPRKSSQRARIRRIVPDGAADDYSPQKYDCFHSHWQQEVAVDEGAGTQAAGGGNDDDDATCPFLDEGIQQSLESAAADSAAAVMNPRWYERRLTEAKGTFRTQDNRIRQVRVTSLSAVSCVTWLAFVGHSVTVAPGLQGKFVIAEASDGQQYPGVVVEVLHPVGYMILFDVDCELHPGDAQPEFVARACKWSAEAERALD